MSLIATMRMLNHRDGAAGQGMKKPPCQAALSEISVSRYQTTRQHRNTDAGAVRNRIALRLTRQAWSVGYGVLAGA